MSADTNTLATYTVLCWDDPAAAQLVPLAFVCEAEDTEHAEEQCENAYPGCVIAWVAQTPDVGIAYYDYWGSPDACGREPKAYRQ